MRYLPWNGLRSHWNALAHQSRMEKSSKEHTLDSVQCTGFGLVYLVFKTIVVKVYCSMANSVISVLPIPWVWRSFILIIVVLGEQIFRHLEPNKASRRYNLQKHRRLAGLQRQTSL
jgi:hypothetical protein